MRVTCDAVAEDTRGCETLRREVKLCDRRIALDFGIAGGLFGVYIDFMAIICVECIVVAVAIGRYCGFDYNIRQHTLW
jgi:hypothetical protein